MFFNDSVKSKVYFIFTVRGFYEDSKKKNELIYETAVGFDPGQDENKKKNHQLVTFPFATQLLAAKIVECGVVAAPRDAAEAAQRAATAAEQKIEEDAVYADIQKPIAGGRKEIRTSGRPTRKRKRRCSTHRKNNRCNSLLSRKVS